MRKAVRLETGAFRRPSVYDRRGLGSRERIRSMWLLGEEVVEADRWYKGEGIFEDRRREGESWREVRREGGIRRSLRRDIVLRGCGSTPRYGMALREEGRKKM